MKDRFYRVVSITVAGLVVFASFTAQAAENQVSHEVYLERANALVRSSQHSAAAMALQQATHLAGDKYPSLYMRLATLYYGLGLIPDAIAAGEKAVSLSPRMKWYKFDLAKFYLVNKQYQRSKEQLLALLQIDPGFALAYVYLGYDYLALGDKNMAWFCLELSDRLGRDGNLLRQKLQVAGGGSPAEPEALAQGQPAYFRFIRTNSREEADALLRQIKGGKSFGNLELELQNSRDANADFGLITAPELDQNVAEQLAETKVFTPPVVVQTGSDYLVMQRILPFNRAAWARLEAGGGTAPVVASATLPPPAPPTKISISGQTEVISSASSTPSTSAASQGVNILPLPSTAPQPVSAVADQHPAATPATEASVAQAIETWRGYWQNADIDRYLACYSSSFVPANGMSLADWRASRERSLDLPSMMEITLSNTKITVEGADQATATFKQDYASDRLQDSVIKTLSLRREDGEWKITAETVEQVL